MLLFVPMVAIGTLLHEAGHIGVAKALGYETRLRFDSMTYFDPSQSIRDDTEVEREREGRRELLVSIGGPAQSMLTGTIGLLLLWRLRRRASGPDGNESSGRLWGATLLALFWTRPVFNGLAGFLKAGELRSDEIKIARYLDWPVWSVAAATGVMGLMACLWVVHLQPAEQRIQLLVGGPIGGLIGFAVWFWWLGPLLLPK